MNYDDANYPTFQRGPDGQWWKCEWDNFNSSGPSTVREVRGAKKVVPTEEEQVQLAVLSLVPYPGDDGDAHSHIPEMGLIFWWKDLPTFRLYRKGVKCDW